MMMKVNQTFNVSYGVASHSYVRAYFATLNISYK